MSDFQIVYVCDLGEVRAYRRSPDGILRTNEFDTPREAIDFWESERVRGTRDRAEFLRRAWGA